MVPGTEPPAAWDARPPAGGLGGRPLGWESRRGLGEASGDGERAFWGAGCYVRRRVTASAASQLREDAADAGAEQGLAFVCVCVFWGCCGSGLPPSPLPFAPRLPNAGSRLSPSRPSRCGHRTRVGHREPLVRGTRRPLSSRRGGKPRRGVGLSGGAGGVLGTGSLFTKPGKTRVRVRQPSVGAAAPAPLPSPPPSPRRRRSVDRAGRGVVAEALAVGAGLLHPSRPGSWSLLPSQHAAPLALGLAAADGLNPWRDLKTNHARIHQTASLLPETLFPACLALISVQEETSLFASKMR